MKKWLVTFTAAFTWTSVLAQDSSSEMVDMLLNQVGGRDVWAELEMIHLKETTWFMQLDEAVEQEIWVDLTSPRVRFHLKSTSMDRVRAHTDMAGWGLLESGKYYEFTPERLKNDVEEWNIGMYRTLMRLARNDKEIKTSVEHSSRLVVSDSDGQQLCWFELGANGRPLSWDNGSSKNLFGPMKQFGEIRMPAWGVSEDGSWNFEYLVFEPVKDPSTITFDSPR